MPVIAVVEDNTDNRLLIHAILNGHFKVTEYCDGPTALAGIRRLPPHLILLDISLPDMDGLEVLARVRSDAALRHLPVIALTAHAMLGDRERFLGAGFDDYVAKPILDENLLFQAIVRLIGPVEGLDVPEREASA
ncbi:MAG: response regulator [Planctomycetes bacterium]|nr:response regulator [Planctomycetota bacterium]